MSTITPALDITADETKELDALALIAKVQHAKTKIEELAAIEKQARDELAVLLDFGTHKIGDHTVTINAPLRFTTESKQQFAMDYPADLFPELYKLEVNTKAADAVAHVDTTPYKHATSIVTTIRG